MKKWRKPFKKAMVIALAAMMIGNTVDMSVLTVNAAEQTILEREEGIICGAFTIRGGKSDTDYSYQDGVLQILTDTALTISNTDSSASAGDRIEVVSKAGANITLAGVKIDVSAQERKAALLLVTSGKVTITLADETENVLKSGLYCAGLQVTSGKTLLVKGNGSLDTTGGSYGAGIGGGDGAAGGEITIEGGTVTATGGNNGVGIGGGYNGAGGTITIKGGTVTAIGKGSGAGIGGGNAGAGGTITIHNGTIEAKVIGEHSNGAGIGGGNAGAGGTITINGGEVTATGGSSGAGIGGGYNGAGGEITIEGGEVTATGGSNGAGIGGGFKGAGGEITIKGETVTATGGSSGAGIGGGFFGAGGEITIEGGEVTATGNVLGAGIGGGNQGAGGTVIISGGTVTANGGSAGAGIGGGVQKAGGTVTISGGTVTANGGSRGAGIGGGEEGAGGTVTISGGTVTATSGSNGAGIGGGEKGAGGTVTISGGNLKATGDSEDGAMAIGHGVSSSEPGTVMDSRGNVLSLYTISLCGLTEAAGVSSLSGINYSVKDMKTLDTNKLYLYLPAEAKLESISLGDEKYRGKLGEEITFHHDNDTDGICDNEGCKEKIANIIYVTSMQTGAVGTVANISMNPADGYVKKGESVTVTAPDMLYYQFQGWYLTSDIDSETHTIKDEANAQSTSFSYTFEPSENTSLVAVYKAAGEVTVKLSGSGYTVSVNDEDPSTIQTSDYTHNFKIGSKVTITAEDDDFLNWKNENGLIVTTQKSYTFTVTGKVTLTMSKKGTARTSAMVEFVSDYHQVISGATYGATDSINFPDGPSKTGYNFNGWSLTEGEIQKQISAGETYIQVTPVYERDESKKYTVTVYVNGEKDESQSVTEVLAGSTKTVKAPEVEGKVFLYWTDETNRILGYDNFYFMQINKNIKIYAVYGDEAVEQKPVIVMTEVSALNVNEKNKLSFTVTRDIPDGYELVEHGVLYNKQQMETEPTEDTFVFGKEGVNKFVSPTTKLSGVVILNVNMTGYENVKVAARGYMIVKNSSNEEEIYYTDVKYISYNEMNEKTEGDN